jgi:hypothetical protein
VTTSRFMAREGSTEPIAVCDRFRADVWRLE